MIEAESKGLTPVSVIHAQPLHWQSYWWSLLWVIAWAPLAMAALYAMVFFAIDWVARKTTGVNLGD